MKPILPSLIALVLVSAVNAHAADPMESALPNNTSTRIAEIERADSSGVVELVSAHYYRHYYGSELVLELSISDRDWRKEIHVYNRPQRLSFAPEWADDEYELKSGGPRAAVLGVENGRTRILVKVPAGYSGYGDPNTHDVYVKTGGSQYSIEGIRLEQMR